jgi:hypothetical protein
MTGAERRFNRTERPVSRDSVWLLTCLGAPHTHRRAEPVAQMVEHLTFNQVVLGSSPSGLTTAESVRSHR